MASPAERKRAQRERQRAAGGMFLQLVLSPAEVRHLRELHRVSADGDPFEAWLKACLTTGAAFKANSGGRLPAGSKIKRDNVTGG